MTQKSAAILLIMSFLVNTAHAAVTLAPGKPAGVDQAQVWDVKNLAVISGGAGNSAVVAPTTTSTK
jgi:hypothetical protein